ncbi:aquaporin-like protein [Cadophora sp. MPI-SDFR-AT-0126]|nr:aquaporin-like protein [Leotiomycetes sp. MPI-SDFR-AT-0126]
MADEQREHGRGENGETSENAAQAEGSPIRPVASSQRSTTPPVWQSTNSLPHNTGLAIPPPYATDQESSGTAPLHLHRAGTLPTRRHRDELDGSSTDVNRRRGRTISAQPKNLERPLSPRSQMFGRSPSTRNRDDGKEGSLGPIPETSQAEPGTSTSRPRRTSISERSFVSPGVRKRSTTWNMAPGRQRGSTLTRRPTIAIEPQGQATGRDFDAQSNNFTLAGPAQVVEVVAAHQPYVDPGYTELNPAYDQPMNTRPVWGLAKPLPRVIRPGMVPTQSELKVQIPDVEQQKQDTANIDLEQGRVEATLNLNKLSPRLQLARQQRENRLVETFGRPSGVSPTSSIEGQQSTNQAHSPRPPSIHSQVIEEDGEEDIGGRRPRPSDLEPVPEQAFPEWDATSAITEKVEEGDLDGDWIGDAIPLNAYDKDTDEIHNLHTHWSVIRLRFREPLAELLAVTVQLTLGFCADLVVVTSNSAAGNEATTDWAWGLATMVGIYVAGGISGAHLNPAISIMLWIYRGFPLRKVPVYVLAQLLGAFIAALISFGLYRNGIIAYGGSDLANGGTAGAFITYPRQAYIDPATAFFTEFTGTAILAVAVLALGDDTNAPPGAGMNAFVLGLIVTVLSMAFGYNTGAAMNPARDLGPRLALLAVGYGNGIFRNGYWFYGPWCGPLSGAIFGAFLYDAAIFVGGESPVNYPRKRMVRAWKKSRVGKKAKKGRGKVRFWRERGERDEMGGGAKL